MIEGNIEEEEHNIFYTLIYVENAPKIYKDDEVINKFIGKYEMPCAIGTICTI